MRFKLNKITIAALLIFLIGPASLIISTSASLSQVAKQKTTASKKTQLEYLLGTGDKLRVSVFGERNLSGTFDVNGLGYVSMPLIGEVEANKKTIKEFENSIIAKLSDGILLEPKVSVEVLNFRPFYILGEIRKPGSYPYFNGVTTLKAVALAGGYTYRANKKKVYIVRASDPTNTKQLIGEHDVILPGDIITVNERFF